MVAWKAGYWAAMMAVEMVEKRVVQKVELSVE